MTMRQDIFLRLPPPTALLLLSSIFDLAAAHAVHQQPQETAVTTVPYHALNVVAWPLPPRPTPAPANPFDLRQRQSADTNTICGYIGGNPALAATCSAGSHCVVDVEHGAMGCCPNGQATCTTGVFTGCVDSNSSPQTEINPYVYTCGGSDVCYRNVFDGGFFQWGCGTASNLATTVHLTATGVTATLPLSSLSVDFTASASSLSAPTTIGTRTRGSSSSSSASRSGSTSSASTQTTHSSLSTSSSISSSTTASSTSSSTTSSTTSSSSTVTSSTTTSSSPTNTTSSAPITTSTSSSGVNVGAIVGGTISGVAVLIALIALGIWAWRRRRSRNIRDGPGGPSWGSTAYISPAEGTGFAPLHQSNEGYETGLPAAHQHGTMTEITGGAAAHHSLQPAPGWGYQPGESPTLPSHSYGYSDGGHVPSYPPSQGYHYPSAYAGAPAAGGLAAGTAMASSSSPPHAGLEADRVPLTSASGGREIDDFSRGFNDALERIGEEDEYPSSGTNSGEQLPPAVNDGHGTHHDGTADGGAAGDIRPLWQQNRRQSRNLMWM